jgi:hypothetical protein
MKKITTVLLLGFLVITGMPVLFSKLSYGFSLGGGLK